MRIICEMDDLTCTFTQDPDSKWTLIAKDTYDGSQAEKKELTTEQVASILFQMHDPDPELDPGDTAYKALEGFGVQILP